MNAPLQHYDRDLELMVMLFTGFQNLNKILKLFFVVWMPYTWRLSFVYIVLKPPGEFGTRRASAFPPGVLTARAGFAVCGEACRGRPALVKDRATGPLHAREL